MRRNTWINAIAMGIVIVASMTLGGLLAVNIGGTSDDAAPRAAVVTATATATAAQPTAAATAAPTPSATAATATATATPTGQPTATVEAAATRQPASEPADALPDLPDLVERVMPSIVQIRVDSLGTGAAS